MASNANKGTVLITGASSGIGAVYADRLAKRGYDLILVARNGDRLRALAGRLSDTTGRAVETVVADLIAADDLARVETTLRTDSSVTMLVNNAGVGSAGPLLVSDIGKMSDLIALNVSAVTRLTYAAVPGFVARGRGTIVNIASTVAIMPELLNGVYGASKAFVLALTRSLHHELAAKGVRVQAVLPGTTATEFWDIAGPGLANMPAAILMSADAMVDAALVGLDQGDQVTIPALPEVADWDRFEAARQALAPNPFSRRGRSPVWRDPGQARSGLDAWPVADIEPHFHLGNFCEVIRNYRCKSRSCRIAPSDSASTPTEMVHRHVYQQADRHGTGHVHTGRHADLKHPHHE